MHILHAGTVLFTALPRCGLKSVGFSTLSPFFFLGILDCAAGVCVLNGDRDRHFYLSLWLSAFLQVF